jgi:S1-C subfamily serine protease
LVLLLFSKTASGQDTPPPQEVLQIEQAMQRVIREVEPSVVSILVSRSEAYRKLFHDQPPQELPGKLGPFNPHTIPKATEPLPGTDRAPRVDDVAGKYDLASPDYFPEATASGVVIDANELLVLTNYHAVRDATKIYVRLAPDKGSYADIHAADSRSDLAVLRLLDEKVRPLKEVKLGDGGAVAKGQLVVTVVNVFAPGFRDGSPGASWGIVSNIRRPAIAGSGEEDRRAFYLFDTLIQTDARLNQGTSGGALVNLRGEMIGLTTSRAAVRGSETAGGLAIPIDAGARRIIERLRQGRDVEYGFLGVICQRVGGGYGLVIDRVVGGSPAEKAGLRIGDTIMKLNGMPVRDVNDLILKIAMLAAGSETQVEVSERSRPITVTLAKQYVSGKSIVSKKAPAIRGIRVDFTSVLWMQSDTPLAFPLQRREIPPGVYVSEVQPGSNAAATKLQVNDVITHVNDQKIDSPAEFYRQAAKVPVSVPLELMLYSFDWNQSQRSTKVVVP